MAPPLVRIANFGGDGNSRVGIGVMVRVQFGPSAALATTTPMTRGEGGLMLICRPTNTAATPARATRMTITRTTTIAVRLPVARGAGAGGHIGGYGAGIVAGGTEVVNGTPQFEQNRFPREFGAPQRGQATIADMRCLRHLGTRRTAANIFAGTVMRCRRQRAASKDLSRDRTFGGRNGCAQDPPRDFRWPGGPTAHRARPQDAPRGHPEAEPGLVRVERREWARRPHRPRRRGGQRHEPPRPLPVRSERGLHGSGALRSRGRGHRPRTGGHRVSGEL